MLERAGIRRQTISGLLCVSAALSIAASPAGGQPAAEDPGGSGTVLAEEKTVEFRFTGADWLNVLQWFADEAEMNLDWQELPSDQLNLTTQRRFTIPEALDVFNLHLLARGFTLLQRDELLLLVKLGEDLNPALVPRVEPEELDQRGRYEYCKVLFPLDWMLAETAVEELKPMLSPYGTITPLTTTNRVEVMDAASNLREVRNLLASEQSDQTEQRLVEEFVLEHARAADVLEKLRQILGLETPLGRMSRDQMRTVREQYELRAEALKRLGDKAPRMKQEGEVYLVANERKNSILANAPPDKLAIIRQSIRALDVPTRGGVQLADVTTMEVYPLNGVDPDAVVDILEDLRDIGKLHPSARFSEDDDRQILFAYASIENHLTIRSVMEQLAGSARTFKVIPLRNLRASYVAESIRGLMGGDSEADEGRYSRRRRRRDDGGWSGFRVEADPPNNRLFLFATRAEFQQVEELLVKIGERSPQLGGRSDDRLRIINTSPEQVAQALEQLRALWPSVVPNPLNIEIPEDRSERGSSTGRDPIEVEDSGDDSAMTRRPDSIEVARYGSARETHHLARHRWPQQRWLTASAQEDETQDELPGDELPAGELPGDESVKQAAGQVEAAEEKAWREATGPVREDEERDASGQAYDQGPAGQAERPGPGSASGDRPRPAVTIRQGAQGQLLLSSQDTRALDEAEQLLRQLMPERKSYSVFHLEHASPYIVELTLQEIFANDPIQARTPMNFVADETTRSIMVFGAGTRELREIEELIQFYDKRPPADPQNSRRPQVFDLDHADANSVAAVLKDVYRDLLSANDRALDRSRDGDSRASLSYASVADVNGELRPRFEGMLSIGILPATNSLIVSAPEFLASEIADTIQQLDRPAVPPTVTRVGTIAGRVNPAVVAQNLSVLLAPREAGESRETDERRDQARDDRTRRRQDDRADEGRERERRPGRGDEQQQQQQEEDRDRGDRRARD